ncbi:MAG: orotidine-5'-phosphate decarboxylase [Gemmatimonadetes bacterium]|nr:orotidine-5'-phosphate decarboxylase [Gemmatimonadota bacterium]MBT8403594.1 orotidine-5'-phosphate decarboxylase [Gemmatimonadota bacterium]NNK62954.1 orotidine-5'-phosphate decarboxylase [Gemmatimonadota bacterium]
MAELILPLDRPGRREALELVDDFGGSVDFYKVGLELFSRSGPDVVRELQDRGKRVFLDLKLMDIPHTVARAVEAAADLGVDLLTVHAVGGTAMLEAAVAAAGDSLRLLAVTVLTSSSSGDLAAVWGRPIPSVDAEVTRLAEFARAAGIHGLVSSAREVRALRAALGPEAILVTPGIRLPGGDAHDQTRVATPDAAVRDGADFLVVGRAITAAADRRAALAEVRRRMAVGAGAV